MSALTSYKLLAFDVYGTLVDWETGVVNALKPLLSKDAKKNFTRDELLHVYHHFEALEQTANPSMAYSEILATSHPKIASKLGLPAPTAEEDSAFSNSVGIWPAFPDTVDALKRLSKHYKLVVLSNVDRASFSRTNEGPLGGVKFDAVLTAQDIGSYKPDLRNFEYMLDYAKREFNIEKDQVLSTAQSQFHDHYPAKQLGLGSAYIARQGAVMGNVEESKQVYDWKFETLGDMADAVEKETRLI
jgi:2-haloalkanoic acid dehalogenase type II